MKGTLVGLALCASAAAGAVVSTTSTTTPNGPDSLWSWVGQINGASAVAIGSHTVLTAGHVGAGDFHLDGTTYHLLSGFAAPNEMDPITHTSSHIDLELVNVKEALPGWYNVASSWTGGANLTMVGYGNTGVVNATGNGYTIINGGGARRAGDNTLDDAQFVHGWGPTVLSFLKNAGDASLVSGDSGGGWFQNGKLIGINDFIFNEAYNSNTNAADLPDYGFANRNSTGWTDPGGQNGSIPAGDPYFGSGAIDLTDPGVQDFIHAAAVPEPSAFAVLGLGLLGLARRKRASRS